MRQEKAKEWYATKPSLTAPSSHCSRLHMFIIFFSILAGIWVADIVADFGLRD